MKRNKFEYNFFVHKGATVHVRMVVRLYSSMLCLLLSLVHLSTNHACGACNNL